MLSYYGEFQLAVKKTIPIRGVKHDCYGDKEQEILDKDKEYARRSIRNNLLGSPDFEEFESFLVRSVEQNDDAHSQKTDEKQPKNKNNTSISKGEPTTR